MVMHRKTLPGFVSALLASLFFAGAAQAADAAAEDGAAVYSRSGCWGCHAYLGQGGRDGPQIAHTALSYEAFSTFVRNSTGDMPPFTARIVPDADLEKIYAYLQSIPEPPAPETLPLLQDVFSD